MSSQKALYLLQAKGQFAIKERDIQEPGPNEVLVEIHATALNPAEWKVQTYGIFITEYPAILGCDAAGIVKKVGAGVTDISVGDRILFQGDYGNRYATFQQYSVMPAELVARIPQNLTLDQASSVPAAAATAALGFYNPKEAGGIALTAPWEEGGRGKYADEPILIIGGSSAVGQQAIQFAKLSGFSPIITIGSLRNEAYLKSLGVTHVIDRAAPLSALPAAVKAITSKPVKVAYDAISELETQNAAYDVLAPGGKLIIVLTGAVGKDKITSEKEISNVHAWVHTPDQREVSKILYANLTGLLESGAIKPNNIEVLPGGLAGISEGLERLKRGISAAKLVVHPQETA
ncbi:uncharacterized protein PHACADRAFT_207436 [Phanerochaete carnosa HHB-10118-sp]|uniref:Enoyl reductase (ER) domain-containing protein n=1 Tax=Phanerochaete carnosa (strain HHB-10118-sp) TaxID=650164 RepID=K5X6W5_PHACS|nr:uncharacterized protein PHACADRAFT_207436 [Phanerochaete carnosa HHB-10118-sp]EKM58627.1 hypothetical protein PHACADRAFT_207436 [Phanerochaete carnosa HHB-10118-sp]